MHEKKKWLNATLEILRNSQKEKKKYYFTLFDKRFIVYPNVFSPKYFNDAKFFVPALLIRKAEKFLEIGTGTGIIAIFAAYKGASKVVATDINPYAVRNAKGNVKLHKLQNKVKILNGNIFQLIPKNEKFDTIFWNTPWAYVKRKNLNMLERSVFDPSYKQHVRFFGQAKRYLNKNGKLLIGFSSSIGHVYKLKQIAKNNGFRLKLLSEKIMSRDYPVKFQLYEAKQYKHKD